MKSIRRILRYTYPFWPSATINIISNILYSILSVASIAMLAPFLQILFKLTTITHTKPVWGWSVTTMYDYVSFYFGGLVEHDSTKALTILCVAAGFLFLLKNIAGYTAAYAVATLRHGVVRDMRNRMYKKILELPIGFFTNESKGNIINRITNDVQEIEWSILQFLEALFKNPILIIAYMFVMVSISLKLTLFVLILLPVTGAVIGYLGKSLRKQSHVNKTLLGHILSTVDETIMGQRVVKGFNAVGFLYEQFKKLNLTLFRSSVRIQRRRDLASPLSEVLGIAAVLLVLWYGGRLVLHGEGGIPAPLFIVYIAAFSQILSPAKALSDAWYSIQKGIASFERVEEILNAPFVIENAKDAISINTFSKEIVYKNVQFTYTGNKQILNNVNLTIAKGATIAVVGPSGAGKSTLADLLPRFYDVTGGSISVDGTDIRQLKMHDLRGLIGIVTQDPILFNDTVYNNIVFGMEGATHEQVEEAARIANAHTFITQLENGYDTIIGDRGGRLSGGQRQRLTIARAVLRNTPILILDEATSSLDTESERLVQDAITRLMQNRTSIVIAHRLSTVQSADMIVVLQEGSIMETGTHSQLMDKDGIYKRLTEMQGLLS